MKVKVSTKRIFMEMMMESDPRKDLDTFLKNLPDFIELDAEPVAAPQRKHGYCCELGAKQEPHIDCHAPKADDDLANFISKGGLKAAEEAGEKLREAEKECSCGGKFSNPEAVHTEKSCWRNLKGDVPPPIEPIIEELDSIKFNPNAGHWATMFFVKSIIYKINELVKAVNRLQK